MFYPPLQKKGGEGGFFKYSNVFSKSPLIPLFQRGKFKIQFRFYTKNGPLKSYREISIGQARGPAPTKTLQFHVGFRADMEVRPYGKTLRPTLVSCMFKLLFSPLSPQPSTGYNQGADRFVSSCHPRDGLNYRRGFHANPVGYYPRTLIGIHG